MGLGLTLTSTALAAWLYLALFRGRFWQLLLDSSAPEPPAWPSVDIIVPARNEAEALPRSLPSLLRQNYPGVWHIILVDDHSTDDTGEIARASGVTVVTTSDLPPGWTGKVAAMNAGVARSNADYILFTDADIEHPADSLRRLVAEATGQQLDLISRMVRLHCETFAEKLLIPAFVFFFAMLYPFRRANDPRSKVAAAAGGVMLVKRPALDAIGGLERIKSALIDDCALAKAIKANGGQIELTLSDDILSLRRYPRVMDIHRMIARTAYTQLNYSPLLLLGTCVGMTLLFLVPPVWPLMWLLYLPMVRLYRLPAQYALTLPLAAIVYVVATIDSARLHWSGKGGQWKGRVAA